MLNIQNRASTIRGKLYFRPLDIKDVYPSITEKKLHSAITFAKEHVNISENDVRLINHCRKSLLFNNQEPWKKKSTESCFDVTMGSYDGADICELIGIYILSLLSTIIDQNDAGLYRDDGLILLRNLNGRQIDQLRKKIIKIFESIGFKIEIVTNLTEVDFLDVTFNLLNNTYRPYKKPNDNPTYIHTSSNHPPQIIKQLSQSISERLSQNSSNEEIFNSIKVNMRKRCQNRDTKRR